MKLRRECVELLYLAGITLLAFLFSYYWNSVLDIVVAWYRKFKEDPIVAFTFALAISTSFLWWDTRGLRKLAAQQAQDTVESLKIAKQAADAATLNAKVLEASEQPWLFVYAPPELKLFDANNQKFQIQIDFGNYGRVPAILARSLFRVCKLKKLPDADEKQSVELTGRGKLSFPLVDCESEYREIEDLPPILGVNYINVFGTCLLPQDVKITAIDGRLVPDVDGNEDFLLNILIIYSGVQHKIYNYKAVWRFDFDSMSFVLVSWNIF